MKLKKIASLMLAGIMAVSMLAGCKTADNNGEEENPVVPVASNAVAYAKDALDADMKDNVDVVASTELDGWTHDIATDSSKLTSDNIKAAYANTNALTYVQKIDSALAAKVKETGVVYGSDFKVMPNGTFSKSYSWMTTISGKVNEKAAVEAAVDWIQSWAKTNIEETVKDGDTIYNCDYTAEISTLKVTNDSLGDENVWVIAVVLTQDLTKAANVEA